MKFNVTQLFFVLSSLNFINLMFNYKAPYNLFFTLSVGLTLGTVMIFREHSVMVWLAALALLVVASLFDPMLNISGTVTHPLISWLVNAGEIIFFLFGFELGKWWF